MKRPLSAFLLALLFTATATWSCGGAPPPQAPATPPPSAETADPPGFDATCSKGIRHQLASLEQPITVHVYTSGRTPELTREGAKVVEVVRWFERGAGGKVVVDVTEAKTRAEIRRAKDFGLLPFDPEDMHGVEPDSAGAAVFGVAFECGPESDIIARVDTSEHSGLRGWIANKIREMAARVEGRKWAVGVVSAKGEIKLSEPNLVAARPDGTRPSMLRILSEALPFYHVEEIDLHGGDTVIRSDLAALVLTQPAVPYTEKELRRIDEAVTRGLPLAVFASAVNVAAGDATMHASLSTWSLEKLLAGYGVEMKREAIFDWGSSMSIPVQLQDGRQIQVPLHGLVLARAEGGGIDGASLPFSRLDELAFPFASPLVTHPEKQPDAAMRTLARSTSSASVDASDSLDLSLGAKIEPKGEPGKRTMAVLLHGKIRSAFGGQAPSAPGRVLIVSSSQFLANPLARAGNPVSPAAPPGQDAEDVLAVSQVYAQGYLTATILALKNTLDWMTLEEDLLPCFEEKGSE